jgi:hypothetical protein
MVSGLTCRANRWARKTAWVNSKRSLRQSYQTPRHGVIPRIEPAEEHACANGLVPLVSSIPSCVEITWTIG